MDPDWLFLNSLEELEQRANIDDPPPGDRDYVVLAIAGLLRKLLLDADPLVHQVNRDRRLKIRYTINVAEPIWEKVKGLPRPVFSTDVDDIDPGTAISPGATFKEVTVDQFLGHVVAYSAEFDFTIKDVILQAAHVMGAVHPGHPETDRNGPWLRSVASGLVVQRFHCANSRRLDGSWSRHSYP